MKVFAIVLLVLVGCAARPVIEPAPADPVIRLGLAASSMVPIIIGPQHDPHLEWINPAGNVGIGKEVTHYELGRWAEGATEGAPTHIIRIDPDGAKVAPNSESRHPMRPIFEALGTGRHILRLRAIGWFNAGPWFPADGLEVLVGGSGPEWTPDAPVLLRVKLAYSSGDCNGDGTVDIADAVILMHYVMGRGEREPSPCGGRV